MRFERLQSIASSVVKGTLASLPTVIRDEAAACTIEFAEIDVLLEIESDLDPDLLGLFEGNARCDPPLRTRCPASVSSSTTFGSIAMAISKPTATKSASPSSTSSAII
jgi:hypothetical protein